MQEKSPKLSVIVPMWGVEKYIDKCARSLFESTLDDMEFVFVDDCTPDKSVEVLQGVIEEYPNRKSQTVIVRHEVNKGLPQARKTGVAAAHGEWISHCDSDDWVAPDMYEKMLKTAGEKGADLVCCDFIYQSDDEILWRPTYDKNKSPEELRKDLMACKVSNAVWNKIVHRSIYETNEIYYPKETMDEDDVFVSQWSYYASHCEYVHECLYYHYANPESVTHQKDRNKYLKGINERITNSKWIIGFLESKKEDDVAEALLFYKRCVKQLVFTRGYGFKNYLEMLNTYSEVNKDMLFSNNYSILNRLLAFLMFISFPIPFYQLAISFLACASSLVHKMSNK